MCSALLLPPHLTSSQGQVAEAEPLGRCCHLSRRLLESAWAKALGCAASELCKRPCQTCNTWATSANISRLVPAICLKRPKKEPPELSSCFASLTNCWARSPLRGESCQSQRDQPLLAPFRRPAAAFESRNESISPIASGQNHLPDGPTAMKAVLIHRSGLYTPRDGCTWGRFDVGCPRRPLVS